MIDEQTKTAPVPLAPSVAVFLIPDPCFYPTPPAVL